METLNARIVGSKLGFDEHRIFDFCLVLEIQNGGGVSLGGYAMDQYNEELKKRVGTEYGMNLIMRILEVVGVNTWEELCGKYIRIKDAKIGDRVTAIGNLMQDEWVDFDTFGKEEE